MSRWFVVPALALAMCAQRGLAQEVVADDLPVEPAGVRGWVRAEGRSQSDGSIDLDEWLAEPQASGVGRAHVDLGEDIRIDISHAHAGGGRGLGYGQATWKDLRIGGGIVGRDAGLHIGVGPRFDLELTRWLRLEAGLDVAIGVGFLDDRDEAGPLPGERRRSFWREGARTGIDVWAGSIAGDVALVASPWRRLELTIGARTAVFAAVAEPRGGDGVPGLDALARETDPGVATTLSEGELGAFAEARASLLRDVAEDGRVLELTLAYREAWDWLHRDLTYTAASQQDPWEDVELSPVPWRSTRTLEVAVRRARGDDWLTFSLDARHVNDSTTSEDFADRDGVSFGARLSGQHGRIYGALSVRHHLESSRLERLLGPMPETAATATFGVIAVDRRDLVVSVEGGVDVGRQDDWGLPRKGHAVFAALTIGFGGSRGDGALRGHALALPPPPRRLSPRVGSVLEQALNDGSLGGLEGALASLDPLERQELEGALEDTGVLDGDVSQEDLRRLLADPDLVAKSEQLVPGITAAVEQLIAAETLTDADLLEAPGALLFSGHGLDGADLGLTWVDGATLSRSFAFGPQRAAPAPAASTDPRLAGLAGPRATGERQDGLLQDLSVGGGGVLDLARRRGWQKLVIARRRGSGHELLFQGATGWSRGMRLVLSGR